jgi:hypothetical protein
MLSATVAAGSAVAGGKEPEARPATADQTLVLARDVMPRIAYRGLEPSQNPVKVEALMVPGRVFHGTLDGVLGTLVDEDVLGDTAPTGLADASTWPAAARLGMDPAEARGNAPMAAGAGPTAGAGIGSAVMRATSGLSDAITRATARVGGVGGGR